MRVVAVHANARLVRALLIPVGLAFIKLGSKRNTVKALLIKQSPASHSVSSSLRTAVHQGKG